MDELLSATAGTQALIRWEQLCAAFEDGWRKGSPEDIGRILSQVPAFERPVLLSRLLDIDLEYRIRSGHSPTEADYATLLPDYATVVTRRLKAAAPSGESVGPLSERFSEVTPSDAGTKGPDSADQPTSSPSPSPPHQRLPGSTLIAIGTTFGPYELVEKLGEGGDGGRLQGPAPTSG